MAVVRFGPQSGEELYSTFSQLGTTTLCDQRAPYAVSIAQPLMPPPSP